jgi:hypothetical protein
MLPSTCGASLVRRPGGTPVLPCNVRQRRLRNFTGEVGDVASSAKMFLSHNHNDSDARGGISCGYEAGGCSGKRSTLPCHGFSVPSVRGVRPRTQLEVFNRSTEVGASRRSGNRFTLQRMQHHRRQSARTPPDSVGPGKRVPVQRSVWYDLAKILIRSKMEGRRSDHASPRPGAFSGRSRVA